MSPGTGDRVKQQVVHQLLRLWEGNSPVGTATSPRLTQCHQHGSRILVQEKPRSQRENVLTET